MQNLIYLMAIATFSFNCTAQKKSSVVKGYAYQRTSLPGMIPNGVIDEKGNEVSYPVKPMITYFIYLEVPHNKDANPTTVWIRGKAFRSVVDKEKTTPVILHKNHLGQQIRKDTLVNRTENTVMRIQPGNLLDTIPGSTFSREIKKSPVVIEYEMGGKKYYSAIKEIKNLEPLVLQ